MIPESGLNAVGVYLLLLSVALGWLLYSYLSDLCELVTWDCCGRHGVVLSMGQAESQV